MFVLKPSVVYDACRYDAC